MQILRRSLFAQHVVMIIILISVLLGSLYQFSISFSSKKHELAMKNNEEVILKTKSLVTYNLQSNKGSLKKDVLEAYLSNISSLNKDIEQIAIFDGSTGKEQINIEKANIKKSFSKTTTEKWETVFVPIKENMTLLDRLSYSIVGFTYGKITDDTNSSFSPKREFIIYNSPIDKYQIQIISSIKSFEDNYASFARAAILSFFIFLIVITIFFLYINIKVILPIRKLKKGAIEIAKGNLRSEIKVKGHDEIGIVGTFFNEVVRNLREITAELYEKDRLVGEVNIASNIQSGLIPPHAPDIPGLDIKIGYKAAEEVGGDSLDFIVMDDDNILMYIGDVSGHGVPAGLVMTMVDVLVHGFSDVYNDLSTMMINLNKHITPKIDASMFMTLLMMNWNHSEQKFTYVGGGHESILHYKAATQEIDDIKAGGIAIGMIDDNTPLIQTGDLKPEINDVIVLYTDGIPEAKGGDGGNEFYGIQRFKEIVKKYAVQSRAELIFESITEDLSKHMGQTKQMDDITMIVIKYVGVSAQEKSIKLSISEEAFKPETRTGKWNWNKG